MKDWTHIVTATQNESVFDLYEHEGVYKVQVDSCELMNGYWHESEDVFGRMAINFARVDNPHILIGGLGLGFTLAAAHHEMNDAGTITVGEVSGAVIGWYTKFMMGKFFPALPGNVTIAHSNVVDILKSGQNFDVIALDVDNGPLPLSQAGNGFLYSAEGLEVIFKCLSDTGILLVWSGFEDWDFIDIAEDAGFTIACKPIRFEDIPDVTYYVFVLSRQKFSAEEQDMIGVYA